MSHRIASYVVAWALVAGTACGGDHAAGPSATYSRAEGKSVLPSTFTHEFQHMINFVMLDRSDRDR